MLFSFAPASFKLLYIQLRLPKMIMTWIAVMYTEWNLFKLSPLKRFKFYVFRTQFSSLSRLSGSLCFRVLVLVYLLIYLFIYWLNMNTYMVESTIGHRSPTKLTTGIHHRRRTTTPGTIYPTLCDKCAGFFTSHRIMNIEGLWDGTSGLSSLSEKTRESNHLQM